MKSVDSCFFTHRPDDALRQLFNICVKLALIGVGLHNINVKLNAVRAEIKN